MLKISNKQALQFNLRPLISGRYLLILAVGAVALILWPGPPAIATGYPLYSQLNSTDVFTGSANYDTQFLGTGLTGTVNEVCIYYKNLDSSGVYLYFSSGPEHNSPDTNLGGTPVIMPQVGYKNKFCQSFSDTILNPNKFYFIITKPLGSANFSVYGTTNNSAYEDGITPADDWVENLGSGTDWGDAYFELNSPNPPPNLVQIDFPAGILSLNDFAAFGFSGNTLFNLTNIQINIGFSSSTFPIFATNYIVDGYGAFAASSTKVVALGPGVYWAKAYLETCPLPYNYYSDCIPSVWNNSTNPTGYFDVWASSTPISFTISNQTGIFSNLGGLSTMSYYYPTSTISSSTEPVQITCDPNDPFFERSLCKLMVALFVPSSDALSSFTGITDGLKTKAPIGYFYYFAQTLFDLNTSSTPTFVLAGIVGLSDIIGPLDIGLAVIVYLLFAFWVFHRSRNLQLS